MSEGPFKPEYFRYCVEGIHALSSMFDDPNAIDKNKCAETANKHPFVKDTELLVRTVYDENKDPGLDAALSAFLSKYFPEKESK